MATVYHRDDAGTPTYPFNFTMNTSDGAPFTALKTILKACLVYGYGSKPAAGWELIAEDTNHIVLRNGSHSGYVCLTHASAVITVWLAETYSGMNGDVMVGSGLKSGTAANNGAAQRLGLDGLVFQSSSTSWYMIADAKTFIFMGGGYSSLYTYSSSAVAGQKAAKPLYVGEDSAGNFMSIGGENTASARGFFSSAGVTYLKNPSTGLLVDTGSVSVLAPAMGLAAETSLTFTLDIVPLFAPDIVAGGVVSALRGVALSPSLMLLWPSIAATAIGGPSTTTRNLNTPISLGDGYAYFIGMHNTYNNVSTTCLITDNPEFW